MRRPSRPTYIDVHGLASGETLTNSPANSDSSSGNGPGRSPSTQHPARDYGLRHLSVLESWNSPLNQRIVSYPQKVRAPQNAPKNGKVTDYLLRNSLTDNVAFLEIKTHQTKLVSGKVAYRGDDVFRVSGEITGSVSQVLNQRDNFQKEYYSLKGKSDESFETLNSKCVVLIGMIKNLTKKQARSFELFRSNSKDVDIVTFDELLARFENLQSLITSDV